jgi:hypothetical protein
LEPWKKAIFSDSSAFHPQFLSSKLPGSKQKSPPQPTLKLTRRNAADIGQYAELVGLNREQGKSAKD